MNIQPSLLWCITKIHDSIVDMQNSDKNLPIWFNSLHASSAVQEPLMRIHDYGLHISQISEILTMLVTLFWNLTINLLSENGTKARRKCIIIDMYTHYIYIYHAFQRNG